MSAEYVEPGRTVKMTCIVFTHHCHDDCQDFPKECVLLKSKRSDGQQVEIVCGGYGNEMGDANETPHVQGWFAMESEVTFGLIKGSFCQKIHYAKMHGTIEESVTYCSKEGDYTAFGDRDGVMNPHARAGQGARHDHDRMKKKLTEGKRKAELWNSDFDYMMKYHRGINEYMSVTGNSTPVEEVHVLWGVAGSGKTATAYKMITDGNHSKYEPEENNSGKLSMESYDGQEVLLLNDFSSDSLGVCTLKRILDPHYGATLPGRGRSVPLRAKKVIITSNYNPQGWYKPEEWAALSRRFTSLTYCGAEEWENQLTGEKFPNQWKLHQHAMQQAAMAAAIL